MKLPELKKLCRVSPPVASIISDGCRDYVVEIKTPGSAGILQDRRGRTMRFKSLASAKRTLCRARVETIELSMRVAADEACAGYDSFVDGVAPFSRLTIRSALPSAR